MSTETKHMHIWIGSDALWSSSLGKSSHRYLPFPWNLPIVTFHFPPHFSGIVPSHYPHQKIVLSHYFLPSPILTPFPSPSFRGSFFPTTFTRRSFLLPVPSLGDRSFCPHSSPAAGHLSFPLPGAGEFFLCGVKQVWARLWKYLQLYHSAKWLARGEFSRLGCVWIQNCVFTFGGSFWVSFVLSKQTVFWFSDEECGQGLTSAWWCLKLLP